MDVNLKVVQGKKIYNIEYDPEKTVMDNLIENNIRIPSPCGGRGTCGKCKMKFLKGSPRRDCSSKNNEYLACRTYCTGNCVIEIPIFEGESFSILRDFKQSKINVNSEFKILKVEIDQNILKSKSIVDFINHKSKHKWKFNLKTLKKLSTLINESSVHQSKYCLYSCKQICMLCIKDRVLDVFRTETEFHVYGIAVDIGTTTIVMDVVNMITGDIIGSQSVLNSQMQFGADVISRIQYSMENSLKIISMTLKDDIVSCVRKLIDSLGIERRSIYKMAISGNNIMRHLLLGLFCDSMSNYPFTSVTNDEVEVDFNSLFKSRLLNCIVYVLPAVSSYVGADILAGMVSCNFHVSNKLVMLVDIGTNGEVALGNGNRILCTSTAAGPAFEGANIENGIGSIKGAISSVKINKKFQRGENIYDISYSTIGNNTAVGICGSGIIDLTAELVKNRIIDDTGRFNRDICKTNFIKVSDKVIFTQKDIREVQMAKSAIRSGIDVLVKRFGCSFDEIYKVYIAGGFGNRINLENAILIGLLPKSFLEKSETVGNSSLLGTVEYLINKNTKNNIQHILNTVNAFDLSMDREFKNYFINNMYFK